jgi:hypothetical protein
MQAAEVGDLLKGQGRIVHKPDGRRLGHQNFVHVGLQKHLRPAFRPGGSSAITYSAHGGENKP